MKQKVERKTKIKDCTVLIRYHYIERQVGAAMSISGIILLMVDFMGPMRVSGRLV